FQPEIVGFGVVRGKFERRSTGLRTPAEFGSLRRLRPFVRWTGRPPMGVPLIEVVQHTKALVQLHPETDRNHGEVCRWIDRQLRRRSSFQAESFGTQRKVRRKPSISDTHVISSPKNHQLDFKVQTKAKVIIAEKAEAKLLD